MNASSIERLRDDLLIRYKGSLRRRFPYSDCRKLVDQEGAEFDDFIPDLGAYFSEIASHCGGVKRVLHWSGERLEGSRRRLDSSFFERYPRYRQLEALITEAGTPDLYAAYAAHEKARNDLLVLFSLLGATTVASGPPPERSV